MARVFNLKTFRKSLGLNQKRFAEEVGFAQGYISELEAGKKSVSEEMIKKFQDLYGDEKVSQAFEELMPTTIQEVEGEINYFSASGDVSLHNSDPRLIQELLKAKDELIKELREKIRELKAELSQYKK